jgi:hypothetical protein
MYAESPDGIMFIVTGNTDGYIHGSAPSDDWGVGFYDIRPNSLRYFYHNTPNEETIVDVMLYGEPETTSTTTEELDLVDDLLLDWQTTSTTSTTTGETSSTTETTSTTTSTSSTTSTTTEYVKWKPIIKSSSPTWTPIAKIP